MPAKGGLVSKGAAAEATHVGFLSCVNTLVPLQRVDLSELLFTVLAAVRTLTWLTIQEGTDIHRSN